MMVLSIRVLFDHENSYVYYDNIDVYEQKMLVEVREYLEDDQLHLEKEHGNVLYEQENLSETKT